MEIAADPGLTLVTYSAEPGSRSEEGLSLLATLAATEAAERARAPDATRPPPSKGRAMEHRILGRTGVSVSKLCLGAMMFGDWGTKDHDESDPDHPPRPRRRHQLHRHRRRLLGRASRRRSSARRSPAAGATTSCSPPRSACRWATTRTAAASRAAGSSREVENSLRRLQHRLDRPLPDPPPRSGHRHRRDPRRAERPRPPGQDPLLRPLDLPRLGDRRGAVDGARARPRALPLRAAAVLDPHPRRSSTTCCRPASATAWA